MNSTHKLWKGNKKYVYINHQTEKNKQRKKNRIPSLPGFLVCSCSNLQVFIGCLLWQNCRKRFNTGSLPSMENKTNVKSNNKQRFKQLTKAGEEMVVPRQFNWVNAHSSGFRGGEGMLSKSMLDGLRRRWPPSFRGSGITGGYWRGGVVCWKKRRGRAKAFRKQGP